MTTKLTAQELTVLVQNIDQALGESLYVSKDPVLPENATADEYRAHMECVIENLNDRINTYCVVADLLVGILVNDGKDHPLPEDYKGITTDEVLEDIAGFRSISDCFKRDVVSFKEFLDNDKLTTDQLILAERLLTTLQRNSKHLLRLEVFSPMVSEIIARQTAITATVRRALKIHATDKGERSFSLTASVLTLIRNMNEEK